MHFVAERQLRLLGDTCRGGNLPGGDSGLLSNQAEHQGVIGDEFPFPLLVSPVGASPMICLK